MSVTRRLLATAAAAALITVPGSPALADNGGKGNSNDKQTICHATSSNTNPYVVNTPNKNGDVDGHAGHTGPVWNPSLKAQHVTWGDIIPPFDYNDHGTAAHFPGQNWDANGQAWFANGCRVPITATVDKTNDANGDGTFSDDETASSVGAAVPFRVVVTNTSVVPAVLGALTDVADGSPVTLSCDPAVVGATIPAGGSVTCSATVAGYSPADGTSKVNTVTVTLREVGDTSNSDSASDSATVRTFVPNPDVSVVKTGPASTAPGEQLTWVLTVHNDGNVPLSAVTLSDSLPAGTTLVSASGTDWTCTGTTDLSCVLGPDLAVDASSAVTVVVTLSADFTGTSITNTAVVTPSDATPADNTSTVTTPVVQPPDVSIVKTGTPTAAPGDQLTWTLTVHNDGNDAVSGVAVSDTLSDGTTLVSASGTGWTCSGTTAVSCTLDAALPLDGTATVTIVATLAEGFTGTSVSNTAVVTPDDATPADNTSTAVTTVTPPGGGGGGATGGFTGGGGGTTTNPPATGGGGGTVPFTGWPFIEYIATALLMTVAGCVLVALVPRRDRFAGAA
jgi:uncharacterized repeat protein (TIGR01451 family)